MDVYSGMKKKLVALTGAGISAESGLKTFRDNDGLWEGYNVYDVATPEAWQRDPEMVQAFYNMRRKEVLNAQPNNAHLLLAKLEHHFNICIITQNIDNLHERAGSTNIIHLHGEITKAQSSINPHLIYPIQGAELHLNEKCELGAPLRPFVVWFGEAVPKMAEAELAMQDADYLLIIGTSLQVYPAASLVHAVPADAQIAVIDPGSPAIQNRYNTTVIRQKATIGLQQWIAENVG
ncbi:MAG: NAD-dependent deacylase [Bacteroidia bacterium]|jgi:NAD-dependent deacetylase|nr:NAD-dependent deacylase [Bacteroidia bacterium]